MKPLSRPISRLLSGAAALLTGLAAQLLLVNQKETLALVFYGVALALIVFALAGQELVRAVESWSHETAGFRRSRWGWAAGGAAVLAALVGLALFWTGQSSGLAWLLHLGSLLLFGAAVRLLEAPPTGEETGSQPGQSNAGGFGLGARWEWAVLAGIFALGIFLRLYRFDQVPFGTWFDEADYGLNALRMLQDPAYRPVYVESTQLPAHLIYLIALSFKLLGVSTLSVRAVSVVFGVATIGAAYLAGREIFDRRTALLLAFLLAVSRWDINWSRIGMHGVAMPLFELLAVGFLLRGLRRQRLSDYAWAGLAMGFGLCFYFSFRLFPLVLGPFLVYQFAVERGLLRRSWRGLLVLALAGVISTIPVTQFALRDPDAFFARMRTTSIFAERSFAEGMQVAARTTAQHLLMFNYQGDHNGRHNLVGEPMLDPVSAALMVLGLAVCLWRFRKPVALFLPFWLIAMLAPGIFSLDFEAPQSYRAIGSLPAAYLLAVVPLCGLWNLWDRTVRRLERRAWVLVPLAALLLPLGWYNYHTYFNRQANAYDTWAAFSTPETIAGRVMAQNGPQDDYYISTFYNNAPTVRFLAPNVTQAFSLETYDSLPIPFRGDRKAILILDADRRSLLDQVRRYYPNAEIQEFRGPGSAPVIAYTVTLTPADIASVQGLTARYYPGGVWDAQPLLERQEPDPGQDWQSELPIPLPFGAEWQGVLYAPQFGVYRLSLQAPAQAGLWIDGVPVFEGEGQLSAEISLARGTHDLRMRAAGGDAPLEFTWQPPGGEVNSVPAWALYASPITNQGLLGRYYPNGDWQAPAEQIKIDPWVYAYYHTTPLPRPYTVEWVGQLQIDQEGSYAFGLEAADESTLWIDDQLVIDGQKPRLYQENFLTLSQGRHSIRVRFSDHSGATYIRLYWAPPGHSGEIIPQTVLYPPVGDPNLLDPALAAAGAPPPPVRQVVTNLAPLLPAGPAANQLWRVGSCGSGRGSFQSPRGLAVDAQGNIYVADAGNFRIVKLDSRGRVLAVFGREGDGDGLFRDPVEVALDPRGGLVVLDSGSPVVFQRFSLDGEYQGMLGAGLGAYHPRGMGMDAQGNLYLADTGQQRVLRLTADGQPAGKGSEWNVQNSGLGAGQPVDAAVAPDGTVYVVEAASGQIWRAEPGKLPEKWAAVTPVDTVEAQHLDVGPDGTLYVTDPLSGRALFLNRDGKVTGQIESLSRPTGIAVSPDGVIYVTDAATCQVLAYQP